MPSKLQFYAQMADHTAEQITGSYQKWTAFLTTAARLYKYPYHEQLMIFAQRPEATACADYELWNNQMRRYVRQGSISLKLGCCPRNTRSSSLTVSGCCCICLTAQRYTSQPR